MKEIYNEQLNYRGVIRAILYDDGQLKLFKSNGGTEKTKWYRDEKTGKLWIPKRKSFISLVKDIIRDN